MKLGIIERISEISSILKDKDLTAEERQAINNAFGDIIKMVSILEGEKDD